MPLPDITLDTNVLLHSCNSIEQRQAHSVALLHGLLACTSKLAIDQGFSLDPASNKSLIGAEYLAKLVPGTLPHQVLIQLALSGRISMVKCSVASQLAQKLNQLVANKRDRTFVKVCSNSNGKAFVSHDFLDFPKAKRKVLEDLFSIEFVDAQVCISKL